MGSELCIRDSRLNGSTDRTGWMVGAYYFDEEIKQDTGLIYGVGFRPYADLLAGGIPGTSPLWDIEALYGNPPGTFQAPGTGLIEASTMDNQAFSIFGQIDIDLGDRATLTLGANYTEDEKDVTFDSTGTDVFSNTDLNNDLTLFGAPLPTVLFLQTFEANTGLPPTPANIAFIESIMPGTSAAITAGVASSISALQDLQFLAPNVDFPNSVENGKTKDDDTTWSIKLAFDVTDDMNIYVSAGTGFKASSWNLSRDSRPLASDQAALESAGLTVPNLRYTQRFAKPEEATVYELGMKARWDTVALKMAIFDQEIENFQSNIFVGTGFQLLNAGKQSTKGLEMDLRWAPTDNFEGTIAGTFMDPKYDSFPVAACVDGDCDLSGTQPPGIHEVSLTAAGRYSFTMGNAAGFARLEYIYEDEIQVIENVPADVASREVSTINASIGLAWENGFEAMLWGRNINNDEYLLSAFPSVAQSGSYSGYPNQPRTYGLTIRKYFN